MPIKEIRRYATLRAEGDATLREHLELLSAHRDALEAQIRVLQEHMDKLEDKIDFYRQEITRAAAKGISESAKS